MGPGARLPARVRPRAPSRPIPLQSWSVTAPSTSSPAGPTRCPTAPPASPAPGSCPGTRKVMAGGVRVCMCARVLCVHTHVCTCCSRRSRLGRCTVPTVTLGPGTPHRPPPLPLSVKHRHVFKTCGPDGQWVTGPRGQSLRNATQCELDAEDLEAQVGRAGGGSWCGAPCPACRCPHLLSPSPGKICQDLW